VVKPASFRTPVPRRTKRLALGHPGVTRTDSGVAMHLQQ
jgi:hypothetical protein